MRDKGKEMAMKLAAYEGMLRFMSDELRAAIEQRNRLMWRHELQAIRQEMEPIPMCGGVRTWDGWRLDVCHESGEPDRIYPEDMGTPWSSERLVELEVEIGEEEVDDVAG